MTPERDKSGSPDSAKERPYEISLASRPSPTVADARRSTHSYVLEKLDDRIAPTVTDPILDIGSRFGGGGDTMAITSGRTEDGQAFTAHVSGDTNLFITPLSSSGVPGNPVHHQLPGGDSRGVGHGDRDGDGKVDVFGAMYVTGEIFSLRGNGDGTFQDPEVIGIAGGNPKSVFLARTAGVTGGEVIAVDQSANAVFSFGKDGHKEMIPVGAFPLDGAAVDLNNDGRDDLVIVHRDGTVTTLLSTGNGRYQSAGTTNLGALGYTVTAYREAGQTYVVAATQSHTLVTYTVDANGALQRIGSVDNVGGQHIYNLRAVDLNADGVRDLVASLFWQRSNSQGGVAVLTGLGNGQFGAPQILQDNQQVVGVTVGSFTPGGQPGIISASIQGGIQTYRNASPLPPPPPPPPGPTPEEIAAASQPPPAPVPPPPEEEPPSDEAIAAAFSQSETDPVVLEILSGLTEGNRLAAANAIPVLERAISDAHSVLPQLEAELQAVLVQRHQNYATDWDVLQVQNKVTGARNRVTRFENALIAAGDLFAREETEVPLRNNVSILGVNHNKLVLKVFVLDGEDVQPEIMVDHNGWNRLELGTTVTRGEDDSFVTVTVPFHGTMNGTVNMDGNRRFRVSVLVDGQRIEQDSLYVQWHPATRTLQLLPESFPHLLDSDVTASVVPDASDLADAQSESTALVSAIAPHVEPVIVGEYSVARNVASSIWSAVGLPTFTNALLASARDQVMHQRYAQIYAQGGHPGASQEEQVWNEVYDASERLMNAASDYHLWLVKRDAGYEPGTFDFTRFECSYPGFPGAAQIRECLECRCGDANRAVEMRKAEENAYYQMILNWTHRVNTQGEPSEDSGVSDAAYLHTIGNIVAGHPGEPLAIISLLGNYSQSVGRVLSNEQLAQYAGVSLQFVLDTFNHVENTEGIGGVNQEPLPVNQTEMDKARKAIESFENAELMTQANSWLRSTVQITVDGQYLHTDTLIGRVIGSLYQDAFGVSEYTMNIRLAIIEKLFGIPLEVSASKLNGPMRYHDYQRTFQALKVLCNDYGYSHVISANLYSREIPQGIADFRAQATVNTVHLSWDIPSEDAGKISHANIYLMNAQGTIQIPNAQTALVSNIKNQMFAEVPFQNFGQSGEFQLKLVYWYNDGRAPAGKMLAEPILVQWNPSLNSAGNLSTLPDGDSNKELAEEALNAILQRPPIDLQAGAWYINIGSGAHDGNGYYSADLNLNDRLDDGQPVFASAKGIIIKIGTDGTHTVVIEHEGQNGKWYTQYLHMDNIGKRNADGSISPFVIGDTVDTNDVIGLVDDEGSPNQFHLHFEVNFTGYFGMGIDTHVLFDQLGVPYKATAYSGEDFEQNGTRQDVFWHESLQAFVTSDATQPNQIGGYHLIYDRIDQVSQSPGVDTRTYWRAYEEGKTLAEMSKVKWAIIDPLTKRAGWLKWDDSVQDFSRIDDLRQEWTPSSPSLWTSVE